MPVGEMLERMTASELTEWIAYDQLVANPQQAQKAADARVVLEALRGRKGD